MNNIDKKHITEAFNSIDHIKTHLKYIEYRKRQIVKTQNYEEASQWRDEEMKFKNELLSLIEVNVKKQK